MGRRCGLRGKRVRSAGVRYVFAILSAGEEVLRRIRRRDKLRLQRTFLVAPTSFESIVIYIANR